MAFGRSLDLLVGGTEEAWYQKHSIAGTANTTPAQLSRFACQCLILDQKIQGLQSFRVAEARAPLPVFESRSQNA